MTTFSNSVYYFKRASNVEGASGKQEDMLKKRTDKRVMHLYVSAPAHGICQLT